MDDLLTFLQDVWSTFNAKVFWGSIAIGLVLLSRGLFQGLSRSLSAYSSPIAMGLLAHRNGHDPNVVNITLTLYDPEKQTMNLWTLMKDSRIRDVLINPFVAYMVTMCAKRCTEDDPVIRFRPPKGIWRYLHKRSVDKLYEHVDNTLVSAAVHECDPMPAFEKACGSTNIEEHDYVVALTFEKGIPDNDQHFRCIIVKASLLEELSETVPSHLPLKHQHRYRTLLAIRKVAREEPNRVGHMTVYTRKDQMFPLKTLHRPAVVEHAA